MRVVGGSSFGTTSSTTFGAVVRGVCVVECGATMGGSANSVRGIIKIRQDMRDLRIRSFRNRTKLDEPPVRASIWGSDPNFINAIRFVVSHVDCVGACF
jgi:hypothetical protein